MKTVLVFLLLGILVCILPVSGVDFQIRMDESTVEHGPRIDATMRLFYDSFQKNNHVYLYGGRGYDPNLDEEVFMDPSGIIWKSWILHTRFNRDANDPKINWEPCIPDNFPLEGDGGHFIPPGRYGHAAVLCPTTNTPVDSQSTPSEDDMLKGQNMINYIVFGGTRQDDQTDPVLDLNSEYSNDLWVCAQYEIRNAGDNTGMRYHWYPVIPELEPEEVWPTSRAFMQIVPLFNEQTPINERTGFLLFGGEVQEGNDLVLLNDAFLGTFTRDMTYPQSTSNEWTFEMGIDVTFQAIDLSELGTIFEVSGASVVYDPYYGATVSPGGLRPRIIITGGIRYDGSSNRKASDDVIVVYPDYTDGSWDWTHLTENDARLPDLGSSNKRAHHTAVLNIRDHTLNIFGGETESGVLNPAYMSLDLTDPPYSWSTNTSVTEVNTSRHNAVFSEATILYRRDGTSPDYSHKVYYDEDEMTFKDDPGKVWEIHKTAPWGLTNPESVVNTRRIRNNDTVRIIQTRSEQGKVNDAFKCNLCFPARVSNVTLEGQMKNGEKPILYQLYDPDSWTFCDGELLEEGRFSREVTEIVFCHPAMTIRNIHFCHFDEDVTYTSDLPEAIPEFALEVYQTLDNGVWDLNQYHSRDPALLVHSAILIENCDFSFNGVGVLFICVASAIMPATIYQCDFYRNFMGVVSLETAHDIHQNVFDDNYMAGIALDKGARTVIRDNRFMDNGQSLTPESTPVAEHVSAVMSNFATSDKVPLNQTPFIFNNTFIDNTRAVAVTESVDRGQYLNRPLFINNVVEESTSGDTVRVANGDQRCELLTWNNCYNAPTPLFTSDQQGREILTQDSIFDDPDLTGDDDLLDDESPCINTGLYVTWPGFSTELGYPDSGVLDIGYHYATGPLNPPDPPEDLDFTGTTLSWSHPSGPTPAYLVIVVLPGGDLMDFYWTSGTSYTLPVNLQSYNLWCAVMSHFYQVIYSDPVWIEYY